MDMIWRHWPLAVLLWGTAGATLTAPSLGAQSQDQLAALRDKKLAHDWVRHGGWVTDYDSARRKAAEDGKVIFAYFTRSYSP